MSVNTRKSKVMVFGGGRFDSDVLQFMYKGSKWSVWINLGTLV